MTVPVPVRDRDVLVVGRGGSALSAISHLRQAGARVTVLTAHVTEDDEPTPAIADLAERGRITLLRRPFTPADLHDRWLVYPRTDDAELDRAIVAAAETARVLAVPELTPVLASAPLPPRSGLGWVGIVGGGPGDPGLITRRGWELLTRADVVVADRLAPLALLDELPTRPLVIDAAKVPGGRAMPQEQINRHLVEHAQAGRVVVRLKGGDPFVFGRGQEEVDACVAAGIAVEVVPGVTSAIAVPALAGVPVTHLGLTHAFTVVSGHLPPGHPDSKVDWTALAHSGATLVLLMAVRTLPAIADALLTGGLSARTPTATIAEGYSADRQIVRASLGDVARLTTDVKPPAVTVIGAVAGLTR